MDSRRKNGSSPKMAITGGSASILTCLSGCCENAIADTSLDAFPAESEVFLAIGNGAGEQETGCAVSFITMMYYNRNRPFDNPGADGS